MVGACCLSEGKLDRHFNIGLNRNLHVYYVTGETRYDSFRMVEKHEKLYPRLSQSAKKYLSCSASSEPSERVFRLAGHLVKKIL